MNKHISILGCGWLGLPLATELVKNSHYVKGSTTSFDKLKRMASQGIMPFIIAISEATVEGSIEEFLKDSELLIINIPPGLRKNPDSDFVKKMKLLVKHIEKSTIEHVLYISSTSVYEDSITIPVITENKPTNAQSASSKQLIAAEELFKTNTIFKTTVLRFGGLIGDGREPSKYLSGRLNVQNPDGPVNLIHQQDCIAIIKALLLNEHWQTDFNAAMPQHPTRAHYYDAICDAHQIPRPQFDHSTPSKGKIISSQKIEHVLDYKFRHKVQ